jgi:hypothetical protein
VWQAKELREAIFGSVAKKRVTGGISDVWQTKELAEEKRGTGFQRRGHRGKKHRVHGGERKKRERRMATGRGAVWGEPDGSGEMGRAERFDP